MTKMTEQERDAYREQKRQQAERALDQLLSEEGWSTWLRLRRNLHSYSMSNQVLIAVQAHEQATAAAAGCFAREGWANGAPDTPCAATPTIVKAASTWKRDGFHPGKGTRGLVIWAFASRRRADGSFSCCGVKHPRKVSNCTECGKPDHYFKLAPVFDASQVRSFENGEPPAIEMPHREPVEGDDLGWLLEPLAAWAVENSPAASVTLDAESGHGEGGSWNPTTHELRVCTGRSDNGRLRTLLHELAHAFGITSRHEEFGLTYAEAEVAVECVSYMVASTAGLDTSSEAIPYMAGWGGAEARDKVRNLAKLIDATAKVIEQPVLELLAAHEHVGELIAA